MIGGCVCIAVIAVMSMSSWYDARTLVRWYAGTMGIAGIIYKYTEYRG